MNNIFEWVKPKNWSLVKVYRDFENYFDWKRVIEREKYNTNSKFNKFELQHTKLYDIFITVTLDEADDPLPEVVKRTKIMESLNPVNKYLDEELGFAGSLSCEFNQFVDDDGKPTLSYFIVYRFIFEKFSLLWLLRFLIITGILLYVIIHFNLIPLLFSWIASLL